MADCNVFYPYFYTKHWQLHQKLAEMVVRLNLLGLFHFLLKFHRRNQLNRQVLGNCNLLKNFNKLGVIIADDAPFKHSFKNGFIYILFHLYKLFLSFIPLFHREICHFFNPFIRNCTASKNSRLEFRNR